ncbi:related to mitochondrial Fe2+ transporter MMT1 and related transporters (cation diffusion facilitator superfamily) [Cephalotrichum gorgonifer]|uniref:Related to mitochondrial Fe2+ transporter MMT1 and related transporters (Cation diffusion facilitator superfamily) n=1 Tax=Cephalotrichum gorgonifer TaxID=2041049 RepID=A0AAE8SSI2_9PEZI|nr:related to mitochondrial Fe2+ transporter MMT1 and related transporters (cation diffusion facilitator superfamily) [Cephalotrichum gorgonifer]
MAGKSPSAEHVVDEIPLSSIARAGASGIHQRAIIPPPSGKDVEFQHDVRDPLGLSAHIKDEAEITANSSRKRRQAPWAKTDGVKDFYLGQNENIRAMLKSVDEHEQEVKDEHGKNNLMYAICVKGSLVANVFLAALQLYGAVSSGSLSLFVTMADSIFDPLSGFMLFMSHRAVDKVDPRRYPSGRARISTAGNIVFSFIMFSVSLVLIVMSARDLAAGSEEETNKFWLPSVIAVAVAFATKLTLFFMCWTIKHIYSQVDILWRDHRNDLFINGFGILTSVGGSKLKWWIDPMGAILLSLLISGLWLHTAYDEFQLLIGVSADRETLQLITYISMTHSPLVVCIDTVRAYHTGPRLLVEVDIVMDRNERLEVIHDVAEDLQIKLERLPCVERAFVHIDYETSHKPEHDLKKLL